ncbi:MAG: hypothetical protein ABIJ45_11215 [Candidatus Zixiibacteriota bacterium]
MNTKNYLLVSGLFILMMFNIALAGGSRDCTSDSLRILLRAYWDYSGSEMIIQDQSNCLIENCHSRLDTIFYLIAGRRDYLIEDDLDSMIQFGNSDEKSDAYYLKGYLQTPYTKGDYDNSYSIPLAYFDSAIQYNDQYDLAYYNKGMIYLKQEVTDSARYYFDRALAIRDDQIHYWLYQSMANKVLGNETACEKSFNKAISICDKSFKAFRFIGDEYYKCLLLEEAIIAYDSALTKRTDVYDLWFNYGICKYRVDSLSSYSQYFDSCLKYIGEKTSMLLNYGGILNYFNLKSIAYKYYNRSLEIDGTEAWGWMYKSNFMAGYGFVDSAVLFLDSAFKYDTRNIFLEHNLMRGYYLMCYGLWEEALNSLNKCRNQDCDDDLIKMKYAYALDCCVELSYIDRALIYCDSLSELKPDDTTITNYCDSLRAANPR